MKLCNDEVIAVIEVNNSNVSIRRPKQYPNKFVGVDSYLRYKSRYRRPILVVTESPHIEEFNVNNVIDFTSQAHVDARPVNGVTGMNIMSTILSLLKPTNVLFDDGCYPVIVINALQEQCSEGNRDTGKFRTRNFLHFWETRKSHLESRLKQVDPSIVLCSCTVGDFNLTDGKNAYHEGSRALFEERFENLLREEFNLVPCATDTKYRFLGSKDLSGLVLDVLDRVFARRQIPIYKTTHPSSWKNRVPSLKNYNAQNSFGFEYNRDN